MNAHSSYQYYHLRQYYQSLDVDRIRNEERKQLIQNGKLNFQAIKAIWLRRMEREGKLICVYCQEPVKIYTGITGKQPKDMATLDHLIPLSEKGLKYDESNFICSCSTCNGKRDILPSFRVTDAKYIF